MLRPARALLGEWSNDKGQAVLVKSLDELNVYQVHETGSPKVIRGYRIGDLIKKPGCWVDVYGKEYSITSRKETDYACNDHGRILQLKDHPFNVHRKLKDRKPFFACPIENCTVAKWGGSKGYPADQETRTARKSLLDLSCTVSKLAAFAMPPVMQPIGQQNYSECVENIQGLGRLVVESMGPNIPKDVIKILEVYGIGPEVKASVETVQCMPSGLVIAVDTVKRHIELD